MFSHLHVHTEYSLLDGMCRIPQLVARAKELGMDSLAITDHGVMYGAIQFYQAARAAGIKPIIGCEVYIAREGQPSRDPTARNNFHLVLLAKNLTGYRNLIELTTTAHLEGFYYKPRIEKKLLAEHHEGLIGLSACIAGEVPALILAGRLDDAKQAALWYKETLGDFYVEIQRHPIAELEQVNHHLIEFSQELGIPLVATNDVHYVNQEDASAHDLLLCIGTNSTVNDEKRIKMAGDFFYLKSADEMTESYRDIPQALDNTAQVAEMCNLKLDFGRLHLPEIALPAGKTPDEYLHDLCYEGLSRYYPDASPAIRERLDMELDVIRKTEFANYFLVVWDFISFTKQKGITYGVRGSAAASIVLHCLGITEIDPMEHRLVFERFLNIERKEMPDIDLDFEDERRDEVIGYVSQKYGQDHVAQIITFGTLGARAALRDVGRALGMAYGDVDRVARIVPFAPNMTLDRAMQESADLRSMYQMDDAIRTLVDSAKRVEGIVRHASTHAAGVVISKDTLTKHVPLQRVARGNGDAGAGVMTQFTMEDIAAIGLLKMDFLGLINLTILRKAVELVKANRGVDIDLHHLPLDDQPTFALLSSGETGGVFQLESAGMRRYIKDLKPHTFEEIAAMVALYRPGPMEHIPTYIRAKKGEEPIRYLHPALEDILKETYGVIVYQEQVLLIVRALASYSLGQADIFRKAMGKKVAEVMKKQKASFLAGAAMNGFSAEVANQIFALIEPFAGYAFNKAHAFSYALIAYQTAYLKANFPADYMTALLMSHLGTPEKVASAVAECRRIGIEVRPPDLNKSQATFAIETTERGAPGIRFGLGAIKNVGLGAVEPVIAERQAKGPFRSVEDFARRADLRSANRRVLESLIRAGALDCLGDRGTLLENVADIVALAQKEQKLRESGQATMFDLWGQKVATPLPELQMAASEVSPREKSQWEKELLGVSFSRQLPARPDASVTLCGDITAEMEGEAVSVVGEVSSVVQLLTRSDRKAFVKAMLEDVSGSLEVMVWPRIYDDTRDLWQEGNIVQVDGKVRMKDGAVQFNCDRAHAYEPPAAAPEPATPPPAAVEPPPAPPPEVPPANGRYHLAIDIGQTSDRAADVARLHDVVNTLKDFAGNDEVVLRVVNGESITRVKLPDTRYCPELRERLVGLVGEAGLTVQGGR